MRIIYSTMYAKNVLQMRIIYCIMCVKGSLINYSGQDNPLQPLRAIQDLSCISMNLSTAESEAASMNVDRV